MQYPDYHGGSIVNLMASLVRARGGAADYADATLLPTAALAPARHIVLLVIDGLGDAWLRRRSADGLLAQARLGALTSVFPSTTATAITSYLTGDAPQQHALTGWFTWLQELGCVLTVLPGNPRFGGVGLGQAGIDAKLLFGHTPVFARLRTPSTAISPAHIARSDFNLAHLGPARLRPYRGLAGMLRQIRRAVRGASEPSFTYAYWPELDRLGHLHGIEGAPTLAHLAAIERHLKRLIAKLAGSDTALVVCADHGQLDSTPADLIDLGEHPALAECLRIPLCGEPRAAFCYVRPTHTAAFERHCSDTLAGRFDLHRSEDLLAAGLFGLGRAHPRLAERIGDYTLIARGANLIHQPLPFERPFKQIGVHGGLSDAELRVPLCLWRC